MLYIIQIGGITCISSSEVKNLLPYIVGAVFFATLTLLAVNATGATTHWALRPYGIISFFDGSGSFADTLAAEIGTPIASLIAELNPNIRAVISAVHGYHQDSKVWVKARNKIPARYLADGRLPINTAALREFLALLPEDALIFFGAGSPCQDNTSSLFRGGFPNGFYST